MPAVVREVSDKNAMAVALIENIQRQDLNALEEAAGIERLLTDFALTHEQAAEAVGRSRSAVTNLLRLLALNPAVKTLLSDGKIDMAHARALLPLPTNKQHAAAKQIIAGKLSVRRTERLGKTNSGGRNRQPNHQQKTRRRNPFRSQSINQIRRKSQHPIKQQQKRESW